MVAAVVRRSAVGRWLLLGAVGAVGAALLIWPQAVAGGIDRGLSMCYRVIIPSLFPFLVLAGFVTRSGVDRAIGRRLEGITRVLFGLPGCCAPAILIGFAGGYPAGGAAVAELLRSGAVTHRQAARMMTFCVNAGPAFIISTVGAGLAGSTRYGAVLLAAHTLASLIIGVAGGLFDRNRQDTPSSSSAATPLPPAAALTDAVREGCQSLLTMCGFVVLFAAVQTIVEVALPWEAGSLLPILTEVTGGCVAVASAGEMRPFLWGAALGWGGLSVHCQLMALLRGEGIFGRRFFAARVLHAALGGLLSALLLRLVPVPVIASTDGATAVAWTASSVPAAITLLAMCILLLFTNSRDGNRGKRQKTDSRTFYH